MAGVMLGAAAAGIMATPMMRTRTRRRIVRTSRRMMNSAGRAVGDIVDIMR
ncbi:hypothetical protein CLCY_11c00250 [Clostridium cylindrosporum DSM 605]|uniref:YtxH domain-containing protein n=2 Tax=Clostridium cylindrosporum TaxID=1495 RepID=A0A0J8G4T8_CLOCY|nr:hypothetical protein CLCY_11c00250 [Clostridium cylindrosporum DSM 605]